jgi:hypothetical protein
MRAFRCLGCNRRSLLYYGPDFTAPALNLCRKSIQTVRHAIAYATRSIAS